MLKCALTGVCLSFLALAATAAHARELSGAQITEAVAGSTVEIDTPAGTKIPVRYSREGRLAGDARELAWYLGSATDVGRWWVAGDQLCHKWVRWFNAEPQCMRITREGQAFRWRNQDGNTGTAAITAPPQVQQAATWLALPRVFPRRAPEAAQEMPAAAPIAEPPRLQEPAAAPDAASVIPAPTESPAEQVNAEASAPLAAPAPLPAVKAPPAQPDAQQADKADSASQPSPQQQPKARSAGVAPPVKPAIDSKTPSVAPRPVPEAKQPPQQPLFKVANVRQDDVLNVRSGPSSDFDIVGELPPGSRGIAITSECRSRWCPVQHGLATGWVNSVYLVPEGAVTAALQTATLNDGPAGPAPPPAGAALHDSPEAPRNCLKPAVRALLERIEQTFGRVQVISTCRPGAMIAGTNHVSRHASGNAVDFKADTRKAAIIQWLIANHRAGGTMTYAGMDHVHIDIGPYFISLAGGRHVSSWRGGGSN